MNKKTRVTDLSGLTGASVNQNARADSNVRLSDSRADLTGLNKSLLPKLRFLEFQDSGEWKTIKLRQLTNLITKGTTPTSLGYEFTSSGINFIKIEAITEEGNIDISKVAAISEECHEALKRSQLEINDILFSIAGALGVVSIVNGDILPANTNQALAIIRLDNKESLGFISNFLKTQNIQSAIMKIKAGAAQPNISLGQLGDFDIFLPQLPEQQKIADCLTSLDDLIAAQSQKVAALQTYKKGLMQNLFPAEGESVPRLRFPEFESAGEWEEKKLEDVCEINPSNGNLPESFVYIDLESVVAGQLISKKKIYRDDAPSRAQRLLKNGDVIYQTVRPYQKNNFYCDFNDENTYVASTGYAQLRAFGVSRFLYQLVHTETFVTKVIARCAGGNYPAISSSELAEITVTNPPDPKEQQRIAELLTALDEQISAQGEALAGLKVHKRGLLQGLFP